MRETMREMGISTGRHYTTLDWVTWGLTTVGAINWGLIGFTGFNLVNSIFGRGLMARVVYSLVGLAGVWSLTRITQMASQRQMEPTLRR